MILNKKNAELLVKEFDHLHIEQVFHRMRMFKKISEHFRNNESLTVEEYYKLNEVEK